MSCICQFHTPGADSARSLSALPLSTNADSSSTADPLKDAGPEELIEESNDANTAVSASDLADCRAENWLLRKKLREYEATIENLEQLVSTLVEKQHQILSEMFNLRTENNELQSECHLQREYHSMERNALVKQLHDARTLYQTRVSALESRSRNCNDNPNPLSGEPPVNSGSALVGSEATCTTQSDNEDQCEYGSDSNEERESNSEEENEDLSGESSDQSSGCSSPIPTCSESSDTDLDDDLSGENSPNSNSETD